MQVASYRPTSLLTTLYNVLEMLLLSKISSGRQSNFPALIWLSRGAIEQAHRVVYEIRSSLEVESIAKKSFWIFSKPSTKCGAKV